MFEKIIPDFEKKILDINSKQHEEIILELQEKLENCLETLDNKNLSNFNIDTTENSLLTNEEKEKIKNESGYSDNTIENINSWEEYEIYKEAKLVEDENGNLIRTDIDYDQKDSMGRTNKERCEQGLPPLYKNGIPIELHHIGQKNDSPLAELTQAEHRGKGNDTVLHNKNKESEIDRQEFARERREYWKNREF